MNIAFFTPKMIIGGAESYIIIKAQWLIEKGHNVLVISQGGENVVNLPIGVKHYQISFDAPYSLKSKDLKDKIDSICKILKCNDIDIVEAHNSFPIFYAYMCSRVIRICIIYNLLNELSHSKNNFNVVNILIKELDNDQRYFTLTTAMNRFVELNLKVKLHPTIIPIPIRNNPKIEIKDLNFILSVCRMSSDKMYVLHLIDGFLKAFCSGEIPNHFKLKIVGDGELYEYVADHCRRANLKANHNCIEMLGTVVGNKLFELYAHCTAYAGMGTTILQCAQYQKPIIKVGFGDMRKYAWGVWGEFPNDVNKIVADAGDFSNKISFEDIIVKLVNDNNLRISAGLKASNIISQTYDLELIMNKWLDSYEELSVKTVRWSSFIHCKIILFNLLTKMLFRIKQLVKSNFCYNNKNNNRI